jgi:hypothetical protein
MLNDVEGALAEVRALALERFPRERTTLETFFAELGRRRAGAPRATTGDPAVPVLPEGTFEDLLSRLEELLEALLAGQAHGLERR